MKKSKRKALRELEKLDGIKSAEEYGKTNSKQTEIQYDLSNDQWIEAIAKQDEGRYLDGETLFEYQVRINKERCLRMLTDFFREKRINDVLKDHATSDECLLDIYDLKDDGIANFIYPKMEEMKPCKAANEHMNKDPLWRKNLLMSWKNGHKLPVGFELKSQRITNILTGFCRLAHDDIFSFASNILWHISNMYSDNCNLDWKMREAAKYGEAICQLNYNLKVYERQKGNGSNPKNIDRRDCIYDIFKSNPDLKSKELWSHFLCEMDAQDKLNKEGKIVCNYYVCDDKGTPLKQEYSYKSFENELSKLRKSKN